MEMLSAPGVKGLRIYLAEKDGEVATVLVGVDANGNDVTSRTLDFNTPCPNTCNADSALMKK